MLNHHFVSTFNLRPDRLFTVTSPFSLYAAGLPGPIPARGPGVPHPNAVAHSWRTEETTESLLAESFQPEAQRDLKPHGFTTPRACGFLFLMILPSMILSKTPSGTNERYVQP
jgi:hypothetical protein